jgi:UDP-MurNAc hydroxylase
VYETTALILKRAMAANMFSHVGISKRVTYKLRQKDARYLRAFTNLLAAYEYEVLPLRRLFSRRTLRVYLRRWREIILYVQLLTGLLAGKSAHQLEAACLRATRSDIGL